MSMAPKSHPWAIEMDRIEFYLVAGWSNLIPAHFHSIQFGPSRSESIRVDPSRVRATRSDQLPQVNWIAGHKYQAHYHHWHTCPCVHYTRYLRWAIGGDIGWLCASSIVSLSIIKRIILDIILLAYDWIGTEHSGYSYRHTYTQNNRDPAHLSTCWSL